MRHFLTILAAATFLLPGPSHSQSLALPPPTIPPSLTYLFTVTIGLVPNARIGHIPLSNGDVTLLEPLSSGRVSGPALNATLSPGLAYPTEKADGTRAYPSLALQGRSDDNVTDVLIAGERIGVGMDGDQWSRLPVSIGGKYAYLQDIFILAHMQADRKTGTVQVGAWCVGCNETVAERINGC